MRGNVDLDRKQAVMQSVSQITHRERPRGFLWVRRIGSPMAMRVPFMDGLPWNPPQSARPAIAWMQTCAALATVPNAIIRPRVRAGILVIAKRAAIPNASPNAEYIVSGPSAALPRKYPAGMPSHMGKPVRHAAIRIPARPYLHQSQYRSTPKALSFWGSRSQFMARFIP